MNIFITDEDPTLCAEVLADQHIRSQIGETARILVTALARHNILMQWCGKPYNINGRFAKWAASSWDNFMWLNFHGLALTMEHYRRFGTVHKSSAEIIMAGNVGHLMHGDVYNGVIPSDWPSCEAANGYLNRNSKTVFDAYCNVLRDKYEAWGEKGRSPTWTNTYPPQWLADTGEMVFDATAAR